MTKTYKIRGSIADIIRAEAGGYRWTNAEALAKAGILYRSAVYDQLLAKYLFKKWYEEKLLHYFDSEEDFAEPDFVTKFFQQAAEARAASDMLKIDMMTHISMPAILCQFMVKLRIGIPQQGFHILSDSATV